MPYDDDYYDKCAENRNRSIAGFAFGLLICAVAALLLSLTACDSVTATAGRKQAEIISAQNHNNAHANSDALFNEEQRAATDSFTKKNDLELEADLDKLASEVTLDAAHVKWQNAAQIAKETTRLHALHDKHAADYAASQKVMSDLRDKNNAVNVGNAQKVDTALNPPKPAVGLAPLNLQASINAAGGSTPPAPLSAQIVK